MIHELNKKLDRLTAQVARFDRLRRRLEALEKDERQIVERIRILFRRLRKEDKDMERLEKISLTKFLAAIQGVKDKRLRREREEAFEARAAYEESKRRLKVLKGERDGIRTELKRLEKVRDEYDALMAQKEKRIKAALEEPAWELGALIRREQALARREQEMGGLIGIADKAASLLSRTVGTLREARRLAAASWFASGFHGHDLREEKRLKVERAWRLFQQAQTALHDLKRAMAGSSFEWDILDERIGKFLKDDGSISLKTIADFFLLDGISGDIEKIRAAYEYVNGVREVLKTERKQTALKRSKSRRERRDFVRRFE